MNKLGYLMAEMKVMKASTKVVRKDMTSAVTNCVG